MLGIRSTGKTLGVRSKGTSGVRSTGKTLGVRSKGKTLGVHSKTFSSHI